MATQEATPPESAINPAENLTGWLEKRDAARESVESQAPAEPTVAPEVPAAPVQPPTPTEADWWETGLANVEHGFLKGRRGPEVEKAFRHVETAKQKAERERNELQQKYEQLQREREADAAARRVQAETTRQPEADPYQKLTGQLLEDPAKGFQSFEERVLKAAEEIADKKLNQYKQETQQETYKREFISFGQREHQAAQQALNLDNETWELRSAGLLVHLTNEASPYYTGGNPPTRAQYLDLYKRVYGEPAQIVVKPAPEPPTPPGAKKPASQSTAAPSSSPMDREMRDAYTVIAKNAGLDVGRFLKRGEKTRA